MEDTEEDPLAVHCFCVCSASVLFGDLGVIKSMERDFLSVLYIYPGLLLHVFMVYHLQWGFFLCCCILLYFYVCKLFWFSC